MFYISVIIFNILLLSSAFSQGGIDPRVMDHFKSKAGQETFIPDTVCVSYEFSAGDSLIYRVEAFDSLSINFDTPLYRKRFEKIVFVIDSVDNLNRFHIRRTMRDYYGKESKGEIRDVERKDSPWVGRTVNLLIDGAGKRYSFGVDDSSSAALTPGGAFVPTLFFDIGIYCDEAGKNWSVKVNDELPENGVPFPLFNYTSLYRFQNEIDTLGENCNRLEFIRTGQGSYKLKSESTNVHITSTTNGFGLLDISKEKNIPIHFYTTVEQKLSVHRPDGSKVSGYHFITQTFTLDQYIPAKKEDK
jgi:hypothetical protein